MGSLTLIWDATRRFFKTLVELADPMVGGPSSITFTEPDEHTLWIVDGGRRLRIDRRRRLVWSDTRVLARFNEIGFIAISHQRADDSDPETWTVALDTGWPSSIPVCRTTDDVEASVVGARLATFTGLRVKRV